MKQARALIIFAREPKDWQVKTRLLKSLDVPTVTSLYKAMIQDVMSLAASVDSSQKFLYYADNDSNTPFLDKFNEISSLHKQKGEELGQRMYNASRDCFEAGYNKVIIIGTDCVELSIADFEAAFEALDKYDFCLGPSRDGGYYLIGMNKCREEVFQNVQWGTSSVLAKTLENIKSTRHNVLLLELKEDIDTGVSLGDFIKRMNQVPQALNTRKIIKNQNIIEQINEKKHRNHT